MPSLSLEISFLFLFLSCFSWAPGTLCQANTSTETSSVAPTTPLISSTTSINELWLKNPGQSAPIDGVSIYLCTVPMSTTSMSTTSYTKKPSNMTSETVKSSFGTKQTGSTLSLGSTESSELPENNQTSNSTVRSTSMPGSSTWYGTSTPFVSSTTSGISGTTANSTTTFSSKSALGSTSTITQGTQGTDSTKAGIRTTLGTSSALSTVSGTGSSATSLSQESSSDFFTTGTSSTKNGTSSTNYETSSTAVSSTSTNVLSTSKTFSQEEVNSTISGSRSSASSSGSTSLGTSISSDTMPTTISTQSTPSGMPTSSDTDGTDGNNGIDGTDRTQRTYETRRTDETDQTNENETTPQTRSNLFESTTTTPISSSSLSLSSTVSNFSDSTSGPITSTSDSEVSSSMSSQKTTEAESDEENSNGISTESISIKTSEKAESSVSTKYFIGKYTEAPRSSSTEFFYSTSSEDFETTEFSNPSREFSDGTSESTNSIGTGSTSSESQSSVTSTENAETSSESTIIFRSESTAKTTTSSTSTISTISDNVELSSESESTIGSPSEPTFSSHQTSKKGDKTTSTEHLSSEHTSSEPITSKPPASTSSKTSTDSFSTSTQLKLLSSTQTTIDVLESTMEDTESSQGPIKTALSSESEPQTSTEKETTATASTSNTETRSSSAAESTTKVVETTSAITTSTGSVISSVEPSEKPTTKSSKMPTTSRSSSASSSIAENDLTTQQSFLYLISTASTTPYLKTFLVSAKSTTTSETSTTSQGVTSTLFKTSAPTSSKASTKHNIITPPLPSQNRKSSPTFSFSTLTTSNRSTPTTTENPLCKQQCPPGYLIGTSMCFKLIPPSSKVNSYQSALSFCKETDRQTLASLDKIRDDSDIKMIQESARLQNIDWLYANGIGSKQERFQKMAWVYSIFSQSLVSSPILMSVGISDFYGNISALCVLPQYCISIDCDVEKLFLAYEYYNSFKQSAGTLLPQEQGDVTCLYGNQKTTKVTCNALGAIYPNPTNIDCEESASERKIIDTTNETVESCQICFGRGTKECQAVVGSNGNVKGYRCVCEEPFAMASCWRTGNPCNTSFCGVHGKCVSVLREVSCICDWGYTGENCEIELAKKYKGDFGYSSAVGATMTLGTIVFRVLKIALMGFTLSNEQEDDPQETHQKLRSYLMTGAGVILCFYSNPTLLAITPAACRFYYVAIHFCYIMAMIQWLFEGWNVNQVLRCVHLNEWEVDWKGNRLWGVKIVPRMIGSFSLLGVFLLITFRTGWNKLAASWTCVGVICQETLNIWIPLFVVVFIIILFGATIYESSTLIKYRCPLLGYKIDMKIERKLGRDGGRRVQKCRKNDLLSLIGLLLLVAQYISIIYCSDRRDEPFYGITAIVVAFIYTAFCAYQEIITCPEDCARLLQRFQRWFPVRFAPDYNPETMWTLPEVREHYSFSKAEREKRYQAFLSRNEKLFIHHRWDLRINEIFAENQEKFEINDALVQIWIEEMNDLKAKNGTVAQKYMIQKVYADYMDTIPDKDPRDAGKLNGRLELVTLAAEDDENGVRLAKFFIVPTFHTFTPEMPDSSHTPQNEIIRNNKRKLMAELEKDIYELTREVSEKQKTFASSAIIFWNYGNKVVR